jgi:hypothetical protein
MKHSFDVDTTSPVKVTAKEFKSKFSGKKECFNFMAFEVRAYLPDYRT